MILGRHRKRLLFIAFHFPPLQGSTGILRTLSFVRNLPDFDWDVTVLTAKTSAYPEVANENLRLIPANVRVVRAPALDAQRQLSIRGRYPSLLTRPDRWQSWIPGAVWEGLRLFRSWRPDAMISTFPIASAHVIGMTLARITGVPWIADFRDPMAQERYPADPRTRRMFWRIDAATFRHAAGVVVTTDGAAADYRKRYRTFPASRIEVVPNGFDQELFDRALAAAAPRRSTASQRLTLLHSGLLDPVDRNPEHFLRALAELRDEGRVSARDLRVVLRATRHDHAYAPRVRELRLEDLVDLADAISYEAALREMSAADGCLIFQAGGCNQQIPAKIYEYMYTGRPIAALTDPAGDTARLLQSLGYRNLARINDVESIKHMLVEFLTQLRSGTAHAVPRDVAQRFSRRGAAQRLARMLDSIVEQHQAGQHPA